MSAPHPEWFSEILEIIGGDIERREVDQVGNRLDSTGGWCLTHDDFAWRFKDSSVQCFRQAIVEDSDTSKCQWVPLSSFMGQQS